MYRIPRRFTHATKKSAPEKVYTAKLTQSELDNLIRLLEFANMEILRTCKKFSDSDFDLKEIFWQYRYNSNSIRKKLQAIKKENNQRISSGTN